MRALHVGGPLDGQVLHLPQLDRRRRAYERPALPSYVGDNVDPLGHFPDTVDYFLFTLVGPDGLPLRFYGLASWHPDDAAVRAWQCLLDKAGLA